MLVALGAEVVAVEPGPAMLVEPRRALPGVRAPQGGAEALPLPDVSVDAVPAGNAMHWFDMAVAGPEIARVLAPGGVLAGLWNVSRRIMKFSAAVMADLGAAGIRAHLSGIRICLARFRAGRRRTAVKVSSRSSRRRVGGSGRAGSRCRATA